MTDRKQAKPRTLDYPEQPSSPGPREDPREAGRSRGRDFDKVVVR